MEQDRHQRQANRDPVSDDLRADVRYLGTLLGTVLREQGGDALLEAVEQARQEAIKLREADDTDLAPLQAARRRPGRPTDAAGGPGVRQLLPHHQHPGAAPSAAVAARRGSWQSPTARCPSRSARRWIACRPTVRPPRSRDFLSTLSGDAGVHGPPDRVATADRAGASGPPRRSGRVSATTRPLDGARSRPPGSSSSWRRSRCSGRPRRSGPRRPTVLDEVAAVLAIVGPSLFAVAPGAPRRASARLRAALSRRVARQRPVPGAALLGRWRPRRQPERDARGHPPDDRAAPDAGADGLPAARRSACP